MKHVQIYVYTYVCVIEFRHVIFDKADLFKIMNKENVKLH